MEISRKGAKPLRDAARARSTRFDDCLRTCGSAFGETATKTQSERSATFSLEREWIAQNSSEYSANPASPPIPSFKPSNVWLQRSARKLCCPCRTRDLASELGIHGKFRDRSVGLPFLALPFVVFLIPFLPNCAAETHVSGWQFQFSAAVAQLAERRFRKA